MIIRIFILFDADPDPARYPDAAPDPDPGSPKDPDPDPQRCSQKVTDLPNSLLMP